MENIQIPINANFCERGNILLKNYFTGALNAWLKVKEKIWIEVAYRPENYPSLDVNIIEVSEKNLAKHINVHFGDDEEWIVKKMNIDGVKVKDGRVVVEEKPCR